MCLIKKIQAAFFLIEGMLFCGVGLQATAYVFDLTQTVSNAAAHYSGHNLFNDGFTVNSGVTVTWTDPTNTSIAAAITNDGTIHVKFGAIFRHSSTLTNNGTLISSATYGNYGTGNNYGSVFISSTGVFYNSAGAQFHNYSSAVFTLNGSSTIVGSFYIDSSSAVFNNNGSVVTVYLTPIYNSGTFNNAGTFYNDFLIQNDLTMTSSGTVTNNFWIKNNATGVLTNSGNIANNLEIYNYASALWTNTGTLTNNASSFVHNASGATFANTGGTITNNTGGFFGNMGTFTSSGTITNASAASIGLSIGSSCRGSTISTADFPASTLPGTGGTYSGSGVVIPYLSSGNTIADSGGTITPAKSVNGFAVAQATTLTINSNTVVNAGGVIQNNLSSAVSIGSGVILTNNGTLTSLQYSSLTKNGIYLYGNHSIFHSTALANRNKLVGANVNAYQDTTYTFSDTFGHELRGPFVLKQGITVSATVQAYWNSDGAVDGAMVFGDTTVSLILLSSLKLGNKGQLPLTSFKLLTNNNSIILSGDNTRLVTTCNNYDALRIYGNGHTFKVGASGYFNMVYASNSIVSDVVLVCSNGSSGQPIFNSPTYISNSIILSAPPDGEYTKFGGGSSYTLTITGDVRIEGFGTRFDNGSRPLTIGRNSMLSVGPGVSLTGVSSLTMTDTTSVLHLDGCDLYVGTTGLQMRRGTLFFEDKVRVLNISYGGNPLAPNTTMSNGFVLGDGVNAGNDVNVRLFGGATVIVAGCMHYNHA